MSKEHLWSVIGRARVDGEFAGRLLGNFDQAVAAEGYKLEPEEVDAAKQAMAEVLAPTPSALPPMSDLTSEWKFQQQKAHDRLEAQVDRMNDLGQFTVKILKDTLGNATATYKAITMMNKVMFWMGVLLFLFAATYGVISGKLVYTLAFAGLGTASFVALFFLGPIEKSQAALSNLIQAEVAFMNYFEQITFWETYGLSPQGETRTPSGVNIEKASAMLQQRAQETVELLQKYLEEPSAPPKTANEATRPKAPT